MQIQTQEYLPLQDTFDYSEDFIITEDKFKIDMSTVDCIYADICHINKRTYEILIYCYPKNRDEMFDLGMYLEAFFGFKTHEHYGYALKDIKGDDYSLHADDCYEDYRTYNPIVLPWRNDLIFDENNVRDNEVVHSIAQKLSKFLDKKIVWEDEF